MWGHDIGHRSGVTTTAAAGPDLIGSVERHVPAAQTGRPDAVDRVVGLVRPMVVRWCRARVGVDTGSRSTEDVTRDICAAITDAISGYRPGRQPFLARVVSIVNTTTIDAYRRSERGAATTGELRHLLDRLPEQQQAVLILRIIEKFSYEEIARLYATTSDDVRLTQHRALRELAAMTAGGGSAVPT